MERSPRSVDQLVAEQVEKWRLERIRAAGQPAVQKPRPVVAVSRQYGARGAALGHMLAERLGCSYWNRELVDEMVDADLKAVAAEGSRVLAVAS